MWQCFAKHCWSPFFRHISHFLHKKIDTTEMVFNKHFYWFYHESEGRIEKSFPRIGVWHYEACRVMTSGDHEGRTFLSHPHTNKGLFC